jgi:hypothetical protein
MEINYEQDLYIDEAALDIEWLNQPMLMLQYTELAAAARREVDRVKEKISVVRAELDKEIRSDPEKFDILKVTESAISNCILIQKRYTEIQNDLIDAQYDYQMKQGAVQAVEHRKQALENLSKLLGLQYFASPTTPRDLPREVQQQQEKKRVNQTIKIGKRKKRN